MISVMRVTGTRNAIASALADRPKGFMNSSRNISPGCNGGIGVPSGSSGLVVVRDLDLAGIAVSPSKADPKLVVDPKAPLAFSIPLQAFQPIPRRLIEIFRSKYPVNLSQFPERYPLDRRVTVAVPVLKYLFSIGIGKGADHAFR